PPPSRWRSPVWSPRCSPRPRWRSPASPWSPTACACSGSTAGRAVYRGAVSAPQRMEDLPYAPYLESFDGDLVAGGDHTEVWFADAEFADADAGGSRVSESALTGVAFTNGRWLRSRFSEVWLDRTRWVGTNLSETNWLDATVLRSLF